MKKSMTPNAGGKIIGVFFDDPKFDDYPFDDPEYRQSYSQFAKMFEDRGAGFWIVRAQERYMGGNRFSEGWKFEKGDFHLHPEPVELNVIYNKGHFVGDDRAVIINEPTFESICTDKAETYRLFPSLFPVTVVAKDRVEAERLLAGLKTDMIVAKPPDQEGGKGVKVLPRAEIIRAIPSYPYLLQEFIDTSDGIEGIAGSMHDLRMNIVGGTLVIAYVREPKAGSYLANESQGGTLTEVSLSKLPREVLAIGNVVDESLQRFPHRVYSIDLGRDRSGQWKLFELNSKPGLDPVGKYPGAERFMQALVDVLLSV